MTVDSNHTKQWKRFSFLIAVSAILTCSVIAAINIAIDPYDVFHTSNIRQYSTANERFNKIEHLLDDTRRYDSFILGASTIGVWDPHDIEMVRPGRRYYNLGVFSGTPKDAHRMLGAWSKAGGTIREVVLGLDYFAFSEPPKEEGQFQHHPVVTGESWTRFNLLNLMKSTMLLSFQKWRDSYDPTPYIYFDFRETGRWIPVRLEQEFATDANGYRQSLFQDLYHRKPSRIKWSEERLEELDQLVKYLQTQQVEILSLINPVHPQIRAYFDEESRQALAKRVRQILPTVIDYSSDKRWANDDQWYYEPKHYRPQLAAILIEDMLNTNH